jgi:hypothetical protein
MKEKGTHRTVKHTLSLHFPTSLYTRGAQPVDRCNFLSRSSFVFEKYFFFESSVNRFPSEPLESLVNEPTH